jgi:hypothetical protein
MESLTVVGLLTKYEKWAQEGNIQFLTKGSSRQRNIVSQVEDLKKDFQEAIAKGGELSENLDWARVHEKGRNLWEQLASAALNHIDSNSKGNSDLFHYLNAATEFEDLLYGLEPYYRDHTLHSLWVYLIGEYLLREELIDLYQNLNWYLFNDIEKEKPPYPEDLIKGAEKKVIDLKRAVNQKKDAIWCIIALCHDLGYSLSKLEKLNEKAKNVLGYFHIPGSEHIGYSLDIEHHYLVNQLLELMSMEVRIVPSTVKDEVLIKCYRDDSTYWRLCLALEKKEHGILSAYLLYKTLGVFADSWVRGTAEEWGLEDAEAVDNLIKGYILFSISQHEFDYAYINEFGGLAELLIIADEVEEFSRYGRKLLSRQYYDTAAEARIDFKFGNTESGPNIEITIAYDVASNRDIYDFFIRKAERFCKSFTLNQDSKYNHGKSEYYKIKSIKLITKKENESLTFQLNSDTTIKAFLPHTKIINKDFPQGEYELIFFDDKINIIINDDQISLRKWFENINN